MESGKPKGFPDSVLIRHTRWSIDYVDKGHPALNDPEDDWLLGVCMVHERRIYICTDQSTDSMRDTLIHEVAHAFHVHRPVQQGMGLIEQEEDIVCFATALILELEAAGLCRIKL